MIKIVHNLKKSSSGQALLEFALVLPLFLLLLFGVVEISKVGYSYVSLNNAVRSVARIASVGGSDSEISSIIASSAPFLDASNLTISITPNETSRRSGSQVIVDASYDVFLTTPFISQVLPNPVVVYSTLAMRLE